MKILIIQEDFNKLMLGRDEKIEELIIKPKDRLIENYTKKFILVFEIKCNIVIKHKTS